MKCFLFIGLACLSTAAWPETMYKCTNNGVVAYQATPCFDASRQNVIESKQPKQETDPTAILDDGVELGPFYVKRENQDSIGAQWFAYKVGVTNKTDHPRKVFLKYKAVDYKGFLIKSVYLTGTIPPHIYKVLTDKNFMSPSELDRVSNWVLDK